MLSFRQLRHFIAVAEELHFGRAAARLNMAQPPLSQQIRRLEKMLGAQLLTRTKRKVELTQAGRVFLDDARSLLQQMERAQHRVRRAAEGQFGHIVIGIIPTGSSMIFGRLLPGFRARYPDIEMVIVNLSTTEQIAALRAQSIDVGFLRVPPPEPSLTTKIIARERLTVMLPRDHPLAALDAVPIAALADEAHVMFPRRLAPDHFDLVASLFTQIGRTMHVAQEAEHLQTRLDMIAGGFGVSLVPESQAAFHRDSIVYLPLADVAIEIETVMATRRDDQSEVLAAFVATIEDLLTEAAADAAPWASRGHVKASPRRNAGKAGKAGKAGGIR